MSNTNIIRKNKNKYDTQKINKNNNKLENNKSSKLLLLNRNELSKLYKKKLKIS